MPSKPPQLTAFNAAAFQLQSVVDAYHLRTPYPPELTDMLLDLDSGDRGPVLELGCGTGEITRALAPHVSRIDAVDISAPMLERARSMPGGDAPSIRWIESPAESLAYDGPYSLVVSGDALHWMDWEVVVPAVRDALSPDGRLVIVSAGEAPSASDDAILELIRQHSAIQDHHPYTLAEELAKRGLFDVAGQHDSARMPFRRSVTEYVDGLHATSGLPRDRMAAPDDFDREVRAILEPQATDGLLELQAFARIWWGRPTG